jgi:small-conductance mechanosensitive channel
VATSDLMQVVAKSLVENPLTFIVPAAIFIVTVLGGLIVRRVMFRIVRQWAASSESHLDVLVTETLRGPILLWTFILGLHLANESSRIPAIYQHPIHTTLLFLWVLSFTIAASQFSGYAIRFYGSSATGARSVTSLSQKLAQLVVLALGLIWMLKVVFGTSLTPLLTAFGVGGLAVALALQDTLSNLFAGFYVSISQLVRIGDYIKLSSGEEGYVTDINWRCTTMRTNGNNMIVVPNNKIGTTIYTNYYLPEPRMQMSISFGVDNNSDIDQVEAILLDETKTSAAHLDGLLSEPPPSVRFNPGPGDFSLGFQVNFYVASFKDQYLVQSELRKRLYKRLVKENINMPFPTRTIIVESKPPGA